MAINFIKEAPTMNVSNEQTVVASVALNAFLSDSFEQQRRSDGNRTCRQQFSHVDAQMDYFSEEISFTVYNKAPKLYQLGSQDRADNSAGLKDSIDTTINERIEKLEESSHHIDELSNHSFAGLLPSGDFHVGNVEPHQQNGGVNISNPDASADHVDRMDSAPTTTRSSAWMQFNPNRIVGLINTGTNCHANSVIQCLLRCEPLRVWVLTSRPRKCSRPSRNDFCCFCALRAVFRRFATAEQAFYGARNLIRGLSALTSVNFTDESDANEFALLLLENASAHHKSYHRERDTGRHSNALMGNGMKLNNRHVGNGLAWIDRIRDFADLFTLKIKRKFQCTHCDESSVVIETHPVVHLPSVRGAVLIKQLQQFMYQRYPERKCNKCRRHIRQQTFVKHRPPVLIVAIPRVSTCMRKTNQKFVYGRQVSLEFADRIRSSSPMSMDRVSASRQKTAVGLKSTYDLCTIITHTGDQSTTGHYSAIVRSKPTRWHFVSDEAHHRLRADEVLSRSDATLLFYVTDFVKPKRKRPAALRVSNGQRSNTRNKVLLNKNSNALEIEGVQDDRRISGETELSSRVGSLAGPEHPTKTEVAFNATFAQAVTIGEENDENSPQGSVEHIDLSLPAPASSLFKLGCENYQLKQLEVQPEWENLDAPRPRKRPRRQRADEISKSFHKFVHNEN